MNELSDYISAEEFKNEQKKKVDPRIKEFFEKIFGKGFKDEEFEMNLVSDYPNIVTYTSCINLDYLSLFSHTQHTGDTEYPKFVIERFKEDCIMGMANKIAEEGLYSWKAEQPDDMMMVKLYASVNCISDNTKKKFYEYKKFYEDMLKLRERDDPFSNKLTDLLRENARLKAENNLLKESLERRF